MENISGKKQMRENILIFFIFIENISQFVSGSASALAEVQGPTPSEPCWLETYRDISQREVFPK